MGGPGRPRGRRPRSRRSKGLVPGEIAVLLGSRDRLSRVAADDEFLAASSPVHGDGAEGFLDAGRLDVVVRPPALDVVGTHCAGGARHPDPPAVVCFCGRVQRVVLAARSVAESHLPAVVRAVQQEASLTDRVRAVARVDDVVQGLRRRSVDDLPGAPLRAGSPCERESSDDRGGAGGSQHCASCDRPVIR